MSVKIVLLGSHAKLQLLLCPKHPPAQNRPLSLRGPAQPRAAAQKTKFLIRAKMIYWYYIFVCIKSAAYLHVYAADNTSLSSLSLSLSHYLNNKKKLII